MRLEEIIVTHKLAERRWRAPNHEAENKALLSLGKHLTAKPKKLFQRLVDITLKLCEAGSAGLSLIEKGAGGVECFKWVATAGAYASYAGGTTPREMSPCGVCLARGGPQIYDRPERVFSQFAGVEPSILEALVVPIFVGPRPVGTIWIVSHTPERRFDREDVRIMESIAGFIAAAILRIESERQLRESETLKRMVLMNSPDCIKVLDEEGKIIYMNAPGFKLLGAKKPSLVLNRLWTDFCDGDFKRAALMAVRQAKNGKSSNFHGEQSTMTGKSKWWDVNVTPLPGSEKRLLVVSRDITRRKSAEDQLLSLNQDLKEHASRLEERVALRTKELQSLNDQLQRLSRKLLRSQEDERSHIAKELHDELGQRLTGLKLLFEGITHSEKDASKLVRVKEEILGIMRQVRDLSFDLRQGLPDHISLTTALRRHFEKLKSEQSLSVKFHCEKAMSPLPRETARTIFRLVQEALTNVSRHAGVSRAVVGLSVEGKRARLTIEDEGKGFVVKRRNGGIGLNGMQERVLLSGGKMEVKSARGHGTRIYVDLPLMTS